MPTQSLQQRLVAGNAARSNHTHLNPANSGDNLAKWWPSVRRGGRSVGDRIESASQQQPVDLHGDAVQVVQRIELGDLDFREGPAGSQDPNEGIFPQPLHREEESWEHIGSKTCAKACHLPSSAGNTVTMELATVNDENPCGDRVSTPFVRPGQT